MRGHKHIQIYDIESEEYVCVKCGEVLPPPPAEKIKPSPLEQKSWTGTLYTPEERAFLRVVRKKQYNMNSGNIKTHFCSKCNKKTKHIIFDKIDDFLFAQCSKCGKKVELGMELESN